MIYAGEMLVRFISRENKWYYRFGGLVRGRSKQFTMDGNNEKDSGRTGF